MNLARSFFTIGAALFATLASIGSAVAGSMQIQQVLFDGVNGVDGLDNPRQIKISPDGKYAYVTSADDNSLLLLNLETSLTPIQVYKNSNNPQLKLEGATGLAVLGGGKAVAVASFYDGAISLFKHDSASKLSFAKAFTNNISPERAFASKEPLNEDRLGLLGAWDLAVSSGRNRLFVASYQSDAIATFNVNQESELDFNDKATSTTLELDTLGRPVSLVVSEKNNALVVAGFEGNMLTVFSLDGNSTLSPKQTIKNGSNGAQHLINPQKLVLSPNEKYLYAACPGSNAIVVFTYQNGQYAYLQSITHADTGDSGLTGVGSMALSKDGSQLFAAGEFDQGLLRFDVKDDGSLVFTENFQSAQHKIEGVTSIAISADDTHLLITLGKMDALYLLRLVGQETQKNT